MNFIEELDADLKQKIVRGILDAVEFDVLGLFVYLRFV